MTDKLLKHKMKELDTLAKKAKLIQEPLTTARDVLMQINTTLAQLNMSIVKIQDSLKDFVSEAKFRQRQLNTVNLIE